MYIRVIGKEINEFKGKDVILFGCGSCGQRALEEFEKVGANILGFCDNNPELAGKSIGSYKIYKPEQLLNNPKANIIITSTFEEEIENQLKAMKLTSYYRIKLGVLKETIPKEQFSNKILRDEEANQRLYHALCEKEPFFIGRLGSVELECISHYLYFLNRENKKGESYPNNVKMMMNINAGFFPKEDALLDKFCRLYLDGLQKMDIIWSMWYSKYEDQIYREYIKQIPIADYNGTALPLNFNNPWTQALKGKRVLIIHPFEESIQENYQQKEKLFTNPNFIPDFELITLKAVQSIAGNNTDYKDWFEALNSMEQKIKKIDFDIALIGAGAYGLPLGYYIKSLGKKAIHIGGFLQLYFGIKGKAWNKLGIYNEHWTSPKPSEVPMNFEKVEAGRYW